MIKGIAFDLEGTIIDVEDVHFQAFVQAAKELGVTLDFERIVKEIPNAIGGGDKLIAEGISKLTGDLISAESILIRKQNFYNSNLQEIGEITPRRGFLNIFEKLTNKGLKVAIGSLTPNNQAQVLLNRSGIGNYFDTHVVVFLEDVRNPKPAPDVYIETARRMGISPMEQLVFEDSATGLQAARGAGSLGVAIPIYTFQENINKLQAAGAYRIFRSWDEVDLAALFAEISNVIP